MGLSFLFQIFYFSAFLITFGRSYFSRISRKTQPVQSLFRRSASIAPQSYISSPQNSTQVSPRLRKAQLRLAEAQGIIPIGASEDTTISIDVQSSTPSLSRVREISWRVAEPAIKYDPISASSKFFKEPITWLIRNVQFILPVALFVTTIIIDVLTGKEEQNRLKRADQILNLISAQSPALIKAGQALASRSDLLPKEYLNSLQKLQDRCPSYPSSEAFKLFESELGFPFSEVMELDSLEPIAAASIGQVYKGRLKSNGAQVAIKIQRPGCEELIAVDLFILRWYAQLVQRVINLLKRDIDLVAIIDDFGELIYREIDYRAEAVNAQRFAELYSTIPDVFVPKIYTSLSTGKVLVMEWVDGARLNDKSRMEEMGLDPSRLIDTLVQCSLRQLLENGFFHADPHAGNLLAMPSGKLCYLDFGMVSYVESAQRLSIIEAVVHLVNRDFQSLANLYVRMGFIPPEVDTAPIVVALEGALPDVLNAPVGELNFKNVIGKLGDIMYKFPFSLPPYYIAIIRCLGVLEGLAIEIDNQFRIINDAYPYIASRLLTDPSVELQQALRQLLFRDGKPRWDRLEELLAQASSTTDYDFSVALDQGLTFLISDQGATVRDELTTAVVGFTEELVFGTVDYGGPAVRTSFERLLSDAAASGSLRSTDGGGAFLGFPLQTTSRLNSLVQYVSQEGASTALLQFATRMADAMALQSQAQLEKASFSYNSAASTEIREEAAALDSASRILKLFVKSVAATSPGSAADPVSPEGIPEKYRNIVRRALREPVSQTVISRIVSELSERIAGKTVQRFLRRQPLPNILNA